MFLMSSHPEWVACSMAAVMLLGDICERFQRFSVCQMEGARTQMEGATNPVSARSSPDQGSWRGCGWSEMVFVHVSPWRSQELLGS